MAEPALICVDWGISSFRAWRVDRDGDVLDEVFAEKGILSVPDGDFAGAFLGLVGQWLTGPTPPPIIASGMITSRNGWLETPYLPLPASAAELAARLTPHRIAPGAVVHFVAGLIQTDERGIPDVMRGEETELVGCIAASAADGGLFVAPGTHSKWALAEGGFIRRFQTFMTGEFYAVLLRHSILGRLAVAAPFDRGGFLRGVGNALADPVPSLLSLAFSARSLALLGDLAGAEVGDYLSGLLIGSEVRAAAGREPASTPVTIVGRGDLAERYAIALATAGLAVVEAPPAMARRGLIEIARRAGLTP